MLHRPVDKFLWDTWIYVHPETGLIHLFYLVREDMRQPCRWIYHAISENWIDWQPVEVLSASALGSPAMGTGMVFRAGGDYYMTTTGGGSWGQSIWLFRAGNGHDLMQWQAVEDRPVIQPAGPWYENNDMPLAIVEAHCRDAFVVEKADGYHALITMRMANGAQGGRACVGHAISTDLRHWELHSPLFYPGSFYQAEVPDYFEWNGWHYILFNDASWFQRHDTPKRDYCTGTFYALSENFEGPYRLPEESFLLGAGNLRFDGYVARQVTWGSQHLLYFHHARPMPALGLPKLLFQDENGEISAGAWEAGIQALRAGPMLLAGEPVPFRMGAVSVGQWSQNEVGGEISAECELGNHHALWAESVSDVDITVVIRMSIGSRAGLVVRFDRSQHQGVLVALDRKRGQCSLEWLSEPLLHHPFCRTEPLDTVRWSIQAETTLRVIVRADYMDVYIDDRLAFSAGLTNMPAQGQLGLFIADGQAAFNEIHVFELRPLALTAFS